MTEERMMPLEKVDRITSDSRTWILTLYFTSSAGFKASVRNLKDPAPSMSSTCSCMKNLCNGSRTKEGNAGHFAKES